MKVDITSNALARALYINGPIGLTTLTADYDARGLDTSGLRNALVSMVSQGQATVRVVTVAGQAVELYALVGGGVG